jgi:hypothetical protein
VDGLRRGLAAEDIDHSLSLGLVDRYGHDFPTLRKLVAAMYSPAGGR